MGDIAKVLYPDTSERGWALRGEIDKAISKSDWSETTKHQSALNFRSVMVANGWTLPDILFGKYTLSGWGVAENEIKKVIDANPIE